MVARIARIPPKQVSTSDREVLRHLERNLKLVEALRAIAREKGATPAQLAIAWVLAQGGDIVPIPGTKRRTFIEQNVAAVDLKLSADEVAQLSKAFPPNVTAGVLTSSLAIVGLTPAVAAASRGT